eukprot:scaffold290133_cov17-Tisochrysis_lutea.AAC.1
MPYLTRAPCSRPFHHCFAMPLLPGHQSLCKPFSTSITCGKCLRTASSLQSEGWGATRGEANPCTEASRAAAAVQPC